MGNLSFFFWVLVDTGVFTVSKMAQVGNQLSLEHNQVRMGFHVPPFNSVNHLHLHVISLPFKNLWRKLKYQPAMPWFTPVNDVMTHLGE
jgi:hypothetical protein